MTYHLMNICISPQYLKIGFDNFPNIVKLRACLLFYEHIYDRKPYNFNFNHKSEQDNFSVRSVSLQQLSINSYKINITKLNPTVNGRFSLFFFFFGMLQGHPTIIVDEISHEKTQIACTVSIPESPIQFLILKV